MKKNSTLIYLLKRYYTLSGSFIDAKPLEEEKDFSEAGSALKNPSGKSIQRILDFSLAFEVMETDSTGQVELILN